jgi:hypothetical protein
MNRVYLLVIIAVFIVAAALGGAYQFYFKAKMDQYKAHLQTKSLLESRLESMHDTFAGVKPDVLVTEWRNNVNPWRSALRDEGRFFEYGVQTIPPVPEQVVSPRLYYKDQYERMLASIQQEAFPRRIPFTNFGIYDPQSIPGNTASREDVRTWLQRLQFGNDMIRLLLDSGVQAISAIEVWPDKHEKDGLIIERTVGVNMHISAKDLANLLEKLRSAERYYNVKAIKIANPYLLTNPPPPLQVEMIFSVAWFNQRQMETQTGAATAATFATAEHAFSAFGINPIMRREVAPTSGFTRWWRNFRKTWLPF